MRYATPFEPLTCAGCRSKKETRSRRRRCGCPGVRSLHECAHAVGQKVCLLTSSSVVCKSSQPRGIMQDVRVPQDQRRRTRGDRCNGTPVLWLIFLHTASDFVLISQARCTLCLVIYLWICGLLTADQTNISLQIVPKWTQPKRLSPEGPRAFLSPTDELQPTFHELTAVRGWKQSNNRRSGGDALELPRACRLRRTRGVTAVTRGNGPVLGPRAFTHERSISASL